MHDSPVPRYWRRSHGVTAADRNPDYSCMNAESGSQFTDSGIWYVLVYRIPVSGLMQCFATFLHEMGYGGSSRKRCRPLQTELTGAPDAHGSDASGSPIFLVRTAHLRLREDPPSEHFCTAQRYSTKGRLSWVGHCVLIAGSPCSVRVSVMNYLGIIGLHANLGC